MSQIVLGKCGAKNVTLDLDILLATRLLIQANSGGGKSWLLRRLAEQLYAKIPVIIIDPEGEFASLREKFDYFLVGEGGDVPAHERSASLLAETLLKLRANAVCDLYETFRKNPLGRHLWVKAFLGGLLDAPKSLWRPTVVIVDEAHVFCPEKGESPAEGVMVGLATAGRKRHFCPIWATQRLALLQKDASSQLQNRMVGLTFEDVDVDRAAALLSVSKEEVHDFKKQVKLLEPGTFFAFGRAISKERVLVQVGPVKTSHEADTGKAAAMEPPPPPEKIKALLPKLADLPKTAEEKAKTEAELRGEIRSLRAQLRGQPKAAAETVKIADPRAIKRAVLDVQSQLAKQIAARDAVLRKMQAGLASIAKTSVQLAGMELVRAEKIHVPAAPLTPARIERSATSPRPLPAFSDRAASAAENNGDLSRPQRNILRALAEFDALGRSPVPKTWVAALAGASHRSSSYSNNLGALRTAGLIQYTGTAGVALTADGALKAPHFDAPQEASEMLARCLRILSGPQQKILQAVAYKYADSGAAISKDELAELAGVSPLSSSFSNNLGALRSAGMIEYVGSGNVKCASWLFLE